MSDFNSGKVVRRASIKACWEVSFYYGLGSCRKLTDPTLINLEISTLRF